MEGVATHAMGVEHPFYWWQCIKIWPGKTLSSKVHAVLISLIKNLTAIYLLQQHNVNMRGDQVL